MKKKPSNHPCTCGGLKEFLGKKPKKKPGKVGIDWFVENLIYGLPLKDSYDKELVKRLIKRTLEVFYGEHSKFRPKRRKK